MECRMRFFLIHRKYRVALMYKSDWNSYESKMLRKDAQLAEKKFIALRYRSRAEFAQNANFIFEMEVLHAMKELKFSLVVKRYVMDALKSLSG